MNKEALIRMFHAHRVSPYDGMAVTAEVWTKSHDYHRLQQQLHTVFSHGSGIVTGLEVIASEPPDGTVYILPGIAVDPLGQVIVMPEPTAFDVGEADGQFCLMLSYGESRPAAADDRLDESSPRYVRSEFGIELGRAGFGDVVGLELAIVRRQDRVSPISDARDPEHPAVNEIDLRYRAEIGATAQKAASVAVIYLGGDEITRHGDGANHLVRALRRSGDICAWVDRDVPLTRALEDYTLVYLVGQKAFELAPGEMQVLYNYVQGGGTLLMESCRRGIEAGDPPADASFADLLSSLGFPLSELEPGHDLLTESFLFAAPPPGFDSARVQVGDGVLFSSGDYGCLWQGARREGLPSREEIRSAIEWGANIVAHALARRERTKGE